VTESDVLAIGLSNVVVRTNYTTHRYCFSACHQMARIFCNHWMWLFIVHLKVTGERLIDHVFIVYLTV